MSFIVSSLPPFINITGGGQSAICGSWKIQIKKGAYKLITYCPPPPLGHTGEFDSNLTLEILAPHCGGFDLAT